MQGMCVVCLCVQAVTRAKDQADSLAQRLHEELQRARLGREEAEKMVRVALATE
jgi:hypothetical protein